MKKLVLILALMLCAGAAVAAPPSYTWDMEWDFSDGLQGWTLASGTGSWVDPATDPWGPMLPDGDVSGGGSANLHAPDGTRFAFDVSSLGLQAIDETTGAAKDGFVLQADMYVPNLRPLGGFNFGYPGNFVEDAGIQLNFTSGKGCWLEGDIESGGWYMKDNSWDNTSRKASWVGEETVSPDTLWWDKWVTVVIDYGYTTAGKFSGWVYVPWDSYVGTAGWQSMGSGDYDAWNHVLSSISVGGGSSWTQTQIDNVKFAYSTAAAVPEPGSMLALGTGLVGLLGVIRRRK